MNVLINDKSYKLKINDTFKSKFFSLRLKIKDNICNMYQKQNKINTFFIKNEIDIIAIDKKNTVIFKYQKVPKNKLIEISNDKNNTDILIFNKSITNNIKIGDTLTFINEDII